VRNARLWFRDLRTSKNGQAEMKAPEPNVDEVSRPTVGADGLL
jgi:hypothetical protein